MIRRYKRAYTAITESYKISDNSKSHTSVFKPIPTKTKDESADRAKSANWVDSETALHSELIDTLREKIDILREKIDRQHMMITDRNMEIMRQNELIGEMTIASREAMWRKNKVTAFLWALIVVIISLRAFGCETTSQNILSKME